MLFVWYWFTVWVAADFLVWLFGCLCLYLLLAVCVLLLLRLIAVLVFSVNSVVFSFNEFEFSLLFFNLLYVVGDLVCRCLVVAML